MKNSLKKFIYAVIVLIPFFLLFFKPTIFNHVKNGVWQVASTPINLLMIPVREVRKLISYRQTYRDYQELKQQVDVLRSRLVGFEELSRENNRYEELLKFKRTLVYSTVVANVVGRNPNNWNTTMVIDRGEDDGIKPGMPVVTALGVVGKIAEVSGNRSKVVLVTDPSFNVGALIQRTRQTGLMTGTLRGFCRLKYLPEEADVRIGDQVVTAKISASFPEGLLLGRVASVLSGYDYPSTEAIVEPALDLSMIEEVIVITD